MMFRALLAAALLSVQPFCVIGQSSQGTPRVILWSSSTYGPDGPWHAINTKIGTPSQSVDLLPGGFWSSFVLTPTICANATLSLVCYAQTAGLYNASASSTHTQTGASGHLEDNYISSIVGPFATFGSVSYIFDQTSVPCVEFAADIPSFDMVQISDGYETLPDGTPYPLTIGRLGLGAPDMNQTWSQGSGQPNFNGTFLSGYLFEQGEVPSNSFGMHIGSPALGIPGSLVIGGYDQSRLIGPVSTQQYGYSYLPIDLIDIGFGVAEGQSPLSFASKSGYLAQGNASIGFSINVQVEPSLPYMYLPRSTCDALAQDLPVTFQPKYGLYFWNTSDPRYSMVSSPAYLAFTFRLNAGNAGNLTINIPFALLSLNLTAPLMETATPYFPCRPTTDTYTLGRAFLQAAFVGVNFGDYTHPGMWFLGQAPGPNTASQATTTRIQVADTSITSSNNDWLQSWQGAWKAIAVETTGGTASPTAAATGNPTSTTPTQSSASSSNSPVSSTGLSTGAIAGIGVGTALAGLAVTCLGLLFCRRRKSRNDRSMSRESKVASSQMSQDYYEPLPEKRPRHKSGGWGPNELDHEREPVEIGSKALPAEMG